MNYSKQREAILQVLRATKSHPNAEWIYEKVKEKVPCVSLATVYRNLSLLEKKGDIIKIDAGFAKDRFDGNPLPHAHFACRACEKVEDLEIGVSLDEAIRKEIGGRAENYSLIYKGLCSDCYNKNHSKLGGNEK